MERKDLVKECPCGEESCHTHKKCWQNLKPTLESCVGCLCWKCIRGKCPVAKLFGGDIERRLREVEEKVNKIGMNQYFETKYKSEEDILDWILDD